jgi:type IV secretion system protein VirB4
MSMILSQLLKSQSSAKDELPKLGYHVSEQVVSFHQNYLTLVIGLDGVPFESISTNELQSRFNGLTKNLSILAKDKGARLGIWTHILRREIDFTQQFEFASEFMQGFSTKYLNRFRNDAYYCNKYYISLVLKYEDMDAAVQELESVGQMLTKALGSYDPEILTTYEQDGVEFSEVFEFWGELLNGSSVKMPLTGSPAFEVIQSADLNFGYNVMQQRTMKDSKFATMYDLQAYPENCKRGMFDAALLKLPCEFTLTQSFTCLNPTDAQAMIVDQRNRLVSVDDKAQHQIDELDVAQAYISTGELAFGDYHASIVVYGKTKEQAITNGVTVDSVFRTQGAVWKSSSLASIPSFFSQFPLYKNRPRKMPKSTRNLASTWSLHNYSVGKSKGNPLGDGSAVMPLQTASKSVYNFNFHYSNKDEDNRGDKIAGHTLILGATGVGKTTTQCAFVGFLERFNPKIFALDKDRGMEIFIRALGGTYFAIQAEVPTGINPFQFPDSPKTRDFLYSLVTACGRDEDGKITAQEQLEIKKAVDSILTLPLLERRFSRLLELIPRDNADGLATRLQLWCYASEGRFAWALDNETNKFDAADFYRIGFDVTDLLKKGYRPSEPILACLFHLKDLMTEKGGLLATIVEEFWLPVQFEITRDQILDILKTGRKRDEFVILVSQSPEDAIGCEIFAAIRDQTPTKIFLPNPDAEFSSYSKCGITDKEFLGIKDLTLESRTFLVKQGHQSAFAILDLYGFGDEIAILSGSTSNVTLLGDVIKTTGENPADWMPEFHARRKGKTTLVNPTVA